MNLPKKPQSRQEILRQKQRQAFVGREDHIKDFRDNLRLPPEEWRFFNISGQGGVGKSTLVRQFRKIAEEGKFITAYTNESENSVLEVMAQFTEQLEQQGQKLNQFSERYKVYRQKKQELEADPDAPQGFSGFLGKSFAKAGFGLAKQIPGSGAVTPFLDEDAISSQVGDWTSFVAKKIGNKDEVLLVQEPLEVLTPLFLQDLCKIAEKVNLALFFDTYERTSSFLDLWFRDILENRYGDLPSNIMLVISGRDELEKDKWCDFEPLLIRFSLEPFTEGEARDFLARKGITNKQVIEVILKLSGRLPLLVATLAVENPKDPSLIGDPSDTAVERFLKWVEKPEYRRIALDAALLPTFNRDTIAVISSEDRAEELFNWLKQMPFIELHRDGWTYHDIARVQMLRHKRRNSLKSWADLHGKLADSYDILCQGLEVSEEDQWANETWRNYTLNVRYHHLCQSPGKYWSSILNEFCVLLKTCNNRFVQLHYAETILQVGKDLESSEIQDWGRQLIEIADGLGIYKEDQLENIEKILTKLVNSSDIESYPKSIIQEFRGDVYRLLKRYDEALKDFDTVIELDPNSEWAIARRGETYRSMEKYEEALLNFDTVIELDPNSEWAIASRSVTYLLMERYDEALKDFDKVIELNPNSDWIFFRGETYRSMEKYEEAFLDFDKVIKLNPNYDWAIASRGETYRSMKLYDEALKDFDKVIELNPDFYWIITDRGQTYLTRGQYEEALLDFDRAIKLDPNYKWAIVSRSVTYLLMKRYDKALLDFDRAIKLDPKLDWVITYRGETYRLMERYDEAIKDFDTAIKFDPNDYLAVGRRGHCHLKLQNYSQVFDDFNLMIEGDPILTKVSNDDYYYRAIALIALGKNDEAKADLQQAIKLVQEDHKRGSAEWANILSLALYYLVAGDFTQAKAFFNDGLSREISKSNIQLLIDHLEDLLNILPDPTAVKLMKDKLEARLVGLVE